MAWEWTVLGSTSISVLHWLSKQCCADINFSVNKLISSVNKALSWKPLGAVSSHAWLGSYPLPAYAVVSLAGTGNQEPPVLSFVCSLSWESSLWLALMK